MHPSSLDFDKKRFGERCHLYLKGHKVTLWTPAQAMEELTNCCCCGDSDTEEEDCGDQEETSFIQVRRAFLLFISQTLIVNIVQDAGAQSLPDCVLTVKTGTEDSA